MKAQTSRGVKRASCALLLLALWHFCLCLGLLPELVAEPCPEKGLGSWDLPLPLPSAEPRFVNELRSADPPVLQEDNRHSEDMMQSQVPGWDGSPGTWLDYVRRVRLEWMKTPEKKRSLLGASLASRLTARAWEVSTELDAGRLQERNGAAYLLDFLEAKLGRTPVPDLGSRLEDLFIRTKRSPGQSMAQWSVELRDAYKRLQRALARARAGRTSTRPSSPATSPTARKKATSSTTGSRMGTPSARRRSSTTGEPEPGLEFPEDDGDRPDDPVPQEDEELGPPEADERTTGTHSRRGNETWSAEEWDAWYRGWWQEDSSPRPWRRRRDHDDSEDEEAPPLPDPEWDKYELEELEVLPPEILGWMLLRRSGLPGHARLAVLAATNNSLDFEVVEKAMRDQEEELMSAERQRESRDHRHRRSYWVEDSGEWGLMMAPATPEEEDRVEEIHWVGSRLPSEVYAVDEPEEMIMEGSDGSTTYWTWHEGEYYTQDDQGIWWSWSDTKPWLEIEECYAMDQEAAKEIADLFAAYQNKIRNFKESRQLVASRNAARGFFPLSKGGKGKTKGKGKGKGKPAQVLAAVGEGKGRSSSSTSSGPPKPGSPTYTGCFICGEKSHDYRQCPKRTSGAPGNRGKGSAASYMVTSAEGEEAEAEEALIPEAGPPGNLLCYTEVRQHEDESEMCEALKLDSALTTSGQMYPGYGIVDTGATETVGSLEAIEAVMSRRREVFGLETVAVYPNYTRSFRFGSGQKKQAASYLHLPQVLNSEQVTLGVFTLDVPQVPILVGIKTLKRLGAVIDFSAPSICFKRVSSKVIIPLVESGSGHLMIDLTKDWMTGATVFDTHFPGRGPSIIRQLASRYKECSGAQGFNGSSKGECVVESNEAVAHDPHGNTVVHDPIGKAVVHDPLGKAVVHDPLGKAVVHDHLGAAVVSDIHVQSRQHGPDGQCAEQGHDEDGAQCLSEPHEMGSTTSRKLAVAGAVLVAHGFEQLPSGKQTESLSGAEFSGDRGGRALRAQRRPRLQGDRQEQDGQGQGEGEAEGAADGALRLRSPSGPRPTGRKDEWLPLSRSAQRSTNGQRELSGCNQSGLWKVCDRCKLRLLYVPAYGATGHFRQAGPLPRDVEVVTTEHQEKESRGETVDGETLRAKAIALEGAEQSLLNKLAKVREQKHAEIQRKTGAAPKSRGRASEATLTQQATSSDQMMGTTPGRKKQREIPSEELEFQERDQWTRVDQPEP